MRWIGDVSERHLATLALAVGLAFHAAPQERAEAQGSSRYDVTHQFNLMPTVPPGAGQPRYEVLHRFYNFASARLPIDRETTQGQINIPPAGGNVTRTADATATNASSEANTNGTVNPFVPGGAISGSIRAWGEAQVGAVNAEAFATSRSSVTARGGRDLGKGRVRWGPRLSSTVSGQATAGIHDPIDFSVFDFDFGTELFGDRLLDIVVDVSGPGEFSMDGTTFALDASDFEFSIDISSPYTLQQGSAHLVVVGGFVTTSSGSGMFADIFPSVGSLGTFRIPFADIELDYDFGDLDDLAGVEFDLSGSGLAVAVPEPSSVALVAVGLLLLIAATRRTYSRERMH